MLNVNNSKTLLVAAVVALTSVLASAGVTLNMATGYMYKDNGSNLLDTSDSAATGGTMVLIADTDGDGFGDLTQATASWVGDPDDVAVGRWEANGFYLGGAGNSFDAVPFDLAGGVTAGDDLLLVWYDTPYSAGAVGPGDLVNFGTFRSDSILSGSDIAWVVPADGSTFSLNFATVSAGGESLDSAGYATQTTVPEPVSMSLLAIGGGLLLRRRRRTA